MSAKDSGNGFCVIYSSFIHLGWGKTTHNPLVGGIVLGENNVDFLKIIFYKITNLQQGEYEKKQ